MRVKQHPRIVRALLAWAPGTPVDIAAGIVRAYSENRRLQQPTRPHVAKLLRVAISASRCANKGA